MFNNHVLFQLIITHVFFHSQIQPKTKMWRYFIWYWLDKKNAWKQTTSKNSYTWNKNL